MTHPLDSCYAKLARANEHLRNLDTEMQAFLETRPYTVEIDTDPTSLELVGHVRVRSAPPLRASTMLGDVVHNLRCVLDHLAWQLVIANGSEPGLHTQFPIVEDNRAMTDAQVRVSRFDRHVAGMSGEAIDAIERLQPCHSAEPTQETLALLGVLDNHDKHRTLHVVGGATIGHDIAVGAPGQAYHYEFHGGLDASISPLTDGRDLFRIPAEIRRAFTAQAGQRPEVKAEVNFALVIEDVRPGADAIYGELVPAMGLLVESTLKQFSTFFPPRAT